MKIIIDGDACPVKDIAIEIAKEKQIDVEIYFDTAHVYSSDYATVKFVQKGFDSVDFAILNVAKRGDIIITNDYGLSGMLITKGCIVLTAFGLEINNDNIEQLLSQRYINQQARKAKVRTKGPKKRTKDDDEKFKTTFLKLLNKKDN